MGTLAYERARPSAVTLPPALPGTSMNTRSVCFALTLLLPSSAYAIQGDQAVRHAPGQRAQRVAHPATQRALTESPAFTAFRARHPGAWEVLWDEAQRTPLRLYGEGWAIDDAALASDDTAWTVGAAVLTDLKDLLGADAAASLEPATIDRRMGITSLVYRRSLHDLDVVDARVALRFKAGRFVLAQLESFPGLTAPDAPTSPASHARQLALELLGPTAAVVVEPQLVVYPRVARSSVTGHLAWRLQVRDEAAPSQLRAEIEAAATDPPSVFVGGGTAAAGLVKPAARRGVCE